MRKIFQLIDIQLVTRSYSSIHNNFVLESVIMGDPANLEEKMNSFMQQTDAWFNDLLNKFLSSFTP